MKILCVSPIELIQKSSNVKVAPESSCLGGQLHVILMFLNKRLLTVAYFLQVSVEDEIVDGDADDEDEEDERR